jgi:hypothetical protein
MPHNLRPILATSRDHSYDFFMPLTVMMWRKVVGAEPIVFLSETEKEWSEKSGQVLQEALTEIGVKWNWVGHIEGYLPAQCAQSSRQHAAALDLPEDDILMTADVDMFPLSREWYLQHDPAKWDFSLFYSNAYGEKYPPYFCTNYLAGTVKMWREIMGLEPTGTVTAQLQKSFDRHLCRYHDSWSGWNFDELYFGSRLKGWDGFPNRCQFIRREGGGPPSDRIDRSGWPSSYDWSRVWVDTHLIRPGALHDNWVRIRPMLEQFLPEKMAWIDSYLLKYRGARYYGK